MDEELRKLVAVERVPSTLKQYAEALLAQSRRVIPLLKTGEVARAYVCAHLAAIEMSGQLSLAEPVVRQCPVSEQTYAKIFSEFRAKLGRARTNDGDDEIVQEVCAILEVPRWQLIRDVVKKQSSTLDWDILGGAMYFAMFPISFTKRTDEQDWFLARFSKIAGRRSGIDKVIQWSKRIPRRDEGFAVKIVEDYERRKRTRGKRANPLIEGRMKASIILIDVKRAEIERWRLSRVHLIEDQCIT
ncbi:hypothetical protein V1512DRAFT_169267 [Lipomyces arxii]|uniref:uncharacterized protein n=1 Tax=Lipomyces arxii TaxID=56418 RepID=UPI0034CD6F12